MPPKGSRAAVHDDSKSDTPAKDKNGHAHANAAHHSNGKLRRVASSTGSNLRDVTNAASLPSPAVPEAAAANAPALNPSVSLPQLRIVLGYYRRLTIGFIQLQWSTFDRDFLHQYRREHHLNTPTAYKSDYHSWVLTQPGSIGLYSPTVARKREFRRQSKDQLANTVRTHFNSQGVQENDVIVEFLHRVKRGGISKLKSKKGEHTGTEPDRI